MIKRRLPPTFIPRIPSFQPAIMRSSGAVTGAHAPGCCRRLCHPAVDRRSRRSRSLLQQPRAITLGKLDNGEPRGCGFTMTLYADVTKFDRMTRTLKANMASRRPQRQRVPFLILQSQQRRRRHQAAVNGDPDLGPFAAELAGIPFTDLQCLRESLVPEDSTGCPSIDPAADSHTWARRHRATAVPVRSASGYRSSET